MKSCVQSKMKTLLLTAGCYSHNSAIVWRVAARVMGARTILSTLPLTVTFGGQECPRSHQHHA
jgi:hypothetical protein